MRKINYIAIHEADTPSGKPFTAKDIDNWHVHNGWHRKPENMAKFNPDLKAIGYHFVIYLDGSVHTGRAEWEIPAAVQGHNSDSVNICLIGSGRYTAAQWEALRGLVKELQARYPGAKVMGHYQFDTAHGKTCPDFDVPRWLKNNMTPDKGNILEA